MSFSSTSLKIVESLLSGQLEEREKVYFSRKQEQEKKVYYFNLTHIQLKNNCEVKAKRSSFGNVFCLSGRLLALQCKNYFASLLLNTIILWDPQFS